MAQRVQFYLSVLILVGKIAQHWGYKQRPPRNEITQQSANQIFLCLAEATIRVRHNASGILVTLHPEQVGRAFVPGWELGEVGGE